MIKTEEESIVWIDYGKTLAIFLVILAHTDLYVPLKNGIYTLSMPVFFFFSGYLFSFDKNPDYRRFFIKKSRQLIIPYIWINFIAYLFWFFIGRKVGSDSTDMVSWYIPIINALLGNGEKMVHDIPIWFLICLFVVENLYYIIFKKMKRRWIGCIGLVIFAYVNYTFSSLYLPFSTNTAIVAIIFYAFGNICNKTSIFKRPKLYFLVISLLLVSIATYENGRIDMYINYYGNYFWFLLGGISGIVLVSSICNYLAIWLKDRNIIKYISRNTLIICGFHLLTFTCIKGIMVYILQIPIDVLHQKIGINIFFSIISILLCLPLVYIINRYLPFVVGRKKIISL